MTKTEPTIISAEEDDVYVVVPCFSGGGISSLNYIPVEAWRADVGGQLFPLTEYEDEFDPNGVYALRYGSPDKPGPCKFPDGEICADDNTLCASLERRCGMKIRAFSVEEFGGLWTGAE